MVRLYRLGWVFCLALTVVRPAFALPPTPRHPAVVRIVAPEKGATSFGSGSLVAVNDAYGLIITNYHVVRDLTGTMMVVFPDGFYSPARVIRVERDWDLAALAIWRPKTSPIPLASQAPQPGDPLSIAGYGSGEYRVASGQCTQYLSPGGNLPFELVELSTEARNGDSGGPIMNNRGELAGVLFGSASGRTTGSYCGRVRWFLDAALVDFRSIPVEGQPNSNEATYAQNRPASTPAPVTVASLPVAVRPPTVETAGQLSPIHGESSLLPSGRNATADLNNRFASQRNPQRSTVIGSSSSETSSSTPLKNVTQPTNDRYADANPLGQEPNMPIASIPATTTAPTFSSPSSSSSAYSVMDYAKTLLALFGFGVISFQSLRFLGKAIG